MLINRFVVLFALTSSAATLATGCSGDDPVEAVENQITCEDVCQRYADCFDGSYDVDGCTNRCTNEVEDDDEQQGKLEACDACMDDKSCVSSVFNCTVECASFVP